MKEFEFKKIDAFATAKSGGNPAGYIRLDSKDSISKDEMQRIARELKGLVSEVGYIYPVNEDTFDLKYYSAEREVEFCGHATIAIMYDIIKNNKKLQNKPEINIVTNKGALIVENRIKSDGAVFIMSPAPEFREAGMPQNDIAAALGIDAGDISAKYEIEIVNAGLSTLLVPIRKLDSILKMSPSLEATKKFCVKNNIDIIEVFCDEVSKMESLYRTRVFASTFGYLEDPATGSGNSAFGYYLLKHGLWGGGPMTIEQNGNRDDCNIIRLCTRLDEDTKRRVMFAGSAVTRVEGKYILA